MIGWNNVQSLVEVKPAKKIWEPKFWLSKPKSGPELLFLSFSQVWFINFPGNYIDNSLEHCLTTSRGKTHEKFFGPRSWVRN